MDQNLDNHDTDLSPRDARLRTKKKRDTDRKAQQRYRQRQKDHIAELESQLQLLKDGGCGQMARLVEENRQLRQELKQVNSLLDGLAEVLGQRQPKVFAAVDSAQVRPASPSEGLGSSEREISSSDAVCPHAAPEEWFDPTQITFPLHASQESAAAATGNGTRPTADLGRKDTMLSESQTVYPEQSWLPMWDSPMSGDLSILSLYKAPAHRGGPNYDPPSSPYDRRLHRLLNVARNHGPSLGLPTVADFIRDDSPNPLSKELKMYKGSLYRQQKPVEFLASYWILYLLLRWRATLEQDALENLPLWMHPTKLQRDVEHLSVIDQVVWPDLREEIIKLSFVDLDAACAVLHDIAQNFVIDIENKEASTAETIRQIVGKLSDLARWKLAPRFFEKHPQWAWTSAR